jgi:hypothetical protein
MSDIPALPYELLWEERELASVANLTRGDAKEFFPSRSVLVCARTPGSIRWVRPIRLWTICAPEG